MDLGRLNFFKNLGAAGGDTLIRSVTTAIVQNAPEMSSAAELRGMEQDLDKANELITKFTHDLQDAQVQYDRETAIHTQMMGAAEHLQAEITALDGQINSTTDAGQKTALSSEKASKERSLATLLGQLEEETRVFDNAKREVDSATSALEEANSAYMSKSKEIVTAKDELAHARTDVERAEIERQRAAKRAEAQRQLAGLSTAGTSNVRVATEALRATAQKVRDAAAEEDRKAATLKQAREQTTDDPNIAAAMAAAAATKTPTGSVADRLAALRR